MTISGRILNDFDILPDLFTMSVSYVEVDNIFLTFLPIYDIINWVTNFKTGRGAARKRA